LTQRQGKLSFVLTITTAFLGLFGAIREVVKELPVYRHERFINLEILPYLLSKVVPLAVIGAIQVAGLLVVVHVLTDLRGVIVTQFFMLWSVSTSAALLGLAISSAVDSNDKAVMLMILVVIPQFLLGNAIIELTGVGKFLAIATILCYWGHDGMKSLFPDDMLDQRFPGTPGPPRIIGYDMFNNPVMGPGEPTQGGYLLFGHNGWFLDLTLLLVFCGIYGTLAYAFLRKKDGPTGKPFGIPLLEMGTWVEIRHRLAWALRRAADLTMTGVRVLTAVVAGFFEKKPQPPAAAPPAA
jgi:hypothetical protein